MLLGLPRLEVNLFKATIEQPVLKSPANSQCIVLYVRHAKTTPYLFFVPMLCLLKYKHTLNTSIQTDLHDTIQYFSLVKETK